MKVADSCVWIEVLASGPLTSIFLPVIAQPADLVVPTMVLLEVHKWVAREIGSDKADLVAGQMHRGRVEPLTSTVALEASDLSRAHQLATADATIYAHAQIAGVTLVTCDRHFEGLPGVEYYPKVKA